jgi:hypothetical protein
MERFIIEAGVKTPYVLLDIDKGILELRGRSTPENAEAFYMNIIDAVKEYLEETNRHLNVTIDFEYFNTSSARHLMLLFKTLKNSACTINWVYEEGDIDMQEAGEDYQEILEDMKFILKEKPENS